MINNQLCGWPRITVLFLFTVCFSVSCDNEKGEAFFDQKYQQEIDALLHVAKNSNIYASNGSAWSQWKEENEKPFQNKNIVRAEVQQTTSSTSLLVERKEYEKLVFFFRNTPQANMTSITRGHMIRNGEKVNVLEYLHGVESQANDLTVIRLVVAE